MTAADDDSIKVFDTEQGVERAMLLSKKYGVANISYTHDPSSVVYSSNKAADYALRYHDLYSNRYHRYFRGGWICGRSCSLPLAASACSRQTVALQRKGGELLFGRLFQAQSLSS